MSAEDTPTKLRAAIIGPGNIGTDLLIKAKRSLWIDPVWVVGIEESPGIRRAQELGIKVTTNGVDGLLPHIQEDNIRIAFDATSAYIHGENARKLNALDVMMIDLTPAALGPFCIPPVNLETLLKDGSQANVNMVTCGGQATIPMVAAVSRVQPVSYAEIVATVASKSVGPGTRKNIDEFTRTTSRAIESIGRARKGKAIIVINPAEPPLIMRDTVHCLTESKPQQGAITESFEQMITEVRKYVPGYTKVNGPIFDDRRVTISVAVEGLGDFLPAYAGNLDIMTAAALRTGEIYAELMQKTRAQEVCQ